MATVNDIGIPGVGSGILEPRRKNRWRVTFANLGGGVDSQPVSMQAKTITRPRLTFDEVELHRYNSVDWVAGKHKWEPCQLVIEDDISGSASKVVNAQSQKQQWLIGAEGQWLAAASEGSAYKFVTYLDMLDGNDTVLEKWILESAWLQAINWGELDYASGDAVTIELTIRYGHARQTILGYAGRGVATGGAGTA